VRPSIKVNFAFPRARGGRQKLSNALFASESHACAKIKAMVSAGGSNSREWAVRIVDTRGPFRTGKKIKGWTGRTPAEGFPRRDGESPHAGRWIFRAHSLEGRLLPCDRRGRSRSRRLRRQNLGTLEVFHSKKMLSPGLPRSVVTERKSATGLFASFRWREITP